MWEEDKGSHYESQREDDQAIHGLSGKIYSRIQ